VSTVTFWATVILASSWLTRWEMGALEPTQGAGHGGGGGLGRAGHAGQGGGAEGGGGDQGRR
jgi:hypothetical protein